MFAAGHRRGDAEEDFLPPQLRQPVEDRLKNAVAAAVVVVLLFAVEAHQRRDVAEVANLSHVAASKNIPLVMI